MHSEAFFDSETAAQRYARHRPLLHGRVPLWLRRHLPQARYLRALDVACGTGDSMLPLRELAPHVEGVDISEAMLAQARARGLSVRRCSYAELLAGNFDLITVGMAWHWFDPQLALAAFKRASAAQATWLVYNFWLEGCNSDPAVDAWLRGWYLQHYPPPRRNAPRFHLPEGDAQLALVAEGQDAVEQAWRREEFIGYLLSQSNVQLAMQAGRSEQAIESELLAQAPPFGEPGRFLFRASYSLVQFRRDGAPVPAGCP